VPWQEYVRLPDVVLTEYDLQASPIDLAQLASLGEVGVARGSSVTDADGTRRATLLFLPGTAAELEFEDGSSQPIEQLTVRATGFTVGPSGPTAMPADLPPASAYTYAVELSADEATNAGAVAVRFNQPAAFYLENFIGFAVGETVPTGYYDRTRGVWVPSN